jgi:hypothetical protein
MDELLPKQPSGSTGLPQNIEHLDPFLEQRVEQRPWEVRSAQWRAWALAEAVFGEGVEVRLSGRGSYHGLRGLLTLTVPFSTLGEHRHREAIFLAWAGADPVLAQVPLIFVFEPAPVPTP